jgi:DnaJ like chaperone protein
MIEILIRVAVSDGPLSNNEEKIIQSAVRIFNLAEERYQTLRLKYISDVEKYYAVLNAKQTDSDAHIKRQYRKLVQDYHPDKIVSKGLPEEFVEFAQNKFREIQEAYDAVKRERGLR